jgi:hypothetical protein
MDGMIGRLRRVEWVLYSHQYFDVTCLGDKSNFERAIYI